MTSGLRDSRMKDEFKPYLSLISCAFYTNMIFLLIFVELYLLEKRVIWIFFSPLNLKFNFSKLHAKSFILKFLEKKIDFINFTLGIYAIRRNKFQDETKAESNYGTIFSAHKQAEIWEPVLIGPQHVPKFHSQFYSYIYKSSIL